VEDTTQPLQSRGSQALAWILCLLFAVAAASGWYQYQQATAATQELARTSEAQIDDLQADIRQSRQANQQLQSELEIRQQEVSSLAATTAELEAELQSELEIRQQEVSSLAATTAELEAELQTSEERINDLRDSVQQSRRSNEQLLSQLDAERAARQQEISRLTATSAELESELQQRLAQQESLNRQVSAASDEKRQLAKHLDDAQARRQQLLEQIAEVSGDVAAKEAALADADQDIRELNQQLEQTLRQQDVLAARIEELNEQQRREAQHFANLKQHLEQELNESRVEITQLKNRMTVINLTSEVLFTSGSARITSTGKQLLEVIAASLNAYPDRAISIEGHTDNVPIGANSSFGSNWELSTARAQAAVDYLQQHARVAPGRLQVVGHGEHQPVASNETSEGRRLNRRIEIRLLPSTEVGI
jgi:chemotaxis protein MotB